MGKKTISPTLMDFLVDECLLERYIKNKNVISLTAKLPINDLFVELTIKDKQTDFVIYVFDYGGWLSNIKIIFDGFASTDDFLNGNLEEFTVNTIYIDFSPEFNSEETEEENEKYKNTYMRSVFSLLFNTSWEQTLGKFGRDENGQRVFISNAFADLYRLSKFVAKNSKLSKKLDKILTSLTGERIAIQENNRKLK